jgi:hypothetical protein
LPSILRYVTWRIIRNWSQYNHEFYTIFRSDIVADYAEDSSENSSDENSSGVDENYDPRGELFDDESSSTDGKV